jgi:hypothetical protein
MAYYPYDLNNSETVIIGMNIIPLYWPKEKLPDELVQK